MLVAATASAAVALSVLGGDKKPDNAVTGSVSDFGVRMAACLAERGWDAAPAKGNSYSVQSEGTDRTRLARDRDECGKRLGYDVYGNPAQRR